jgi:diguanylate cyclase (GGDEF)-like protein
MNEAVSPFEEPWPDDEMQLVVDAVRSAVTAPRPHLTGDTLNGSDGLSAASRDPRDPIENSLAEAGRRWAGAHQSASLMRSRLDQVETSMDAELDTGTEADRAAYHRAWRTVTDAATWTSLNQLEQAALLDPLTGVGNRRALDLQLTRAMSGARRTGSELVVVAIDLDGLKRINDTRGHAEGDRTLTSLVDAIGEGLRTSDTVFRTGGDEFAMILQGIELSEVEPLMHRISDGGTPKFTWGAAAFGAQHRSPSELLHAADTDLYRRRGVDRGMVGAGAVGLVAAGVVGLAGAGAVVDLRHPHGSLGSRVSRRVSVAVAAGLVAIGGTVAAVTLSPGTQTASPPRHSNPPSGSSGTSPTTAPGSSTPSASTPASSSTPGENLSPFQLATQITPSTTSTVGTPSTTSPAPANSATVPSPTTTPSGPTSPASPTGTPPPPSPSGAVSGLVVGLETTLGLGQLVASPIK